jgi:methionyl-tRNA formyltransferase
VSLSSSIRKNTSSIRVVLCSYPGIYADVVIKELQKNADIKLTGLVYSERIFSAQETWIGGAVRLIKTSGIGYAVLQFFQTDAYFFFKKVLLCQQIERGVPVLRTKNINTESGITYLKDLKPDVILLANFNQKVSEAVISIPVLACLNIHPSLLPAYKGVDPVFAALSKNEKCLGVTIHKVDENFDTGAILMQANRPVENDKSVFYHQLRLFREGSKLAVSVIKQVANGNFQTTENTGGNYDSWPTKTQINLFIKCGGRLIRWRDYVTALKQELLGYK